MNIYRVIAGEFCCVDDGVPAYVGRNALPQAKEALLPAQQAAPLCTMISLLELFPTQPMLPPAVAQQLHFLMPLAALCRAARTAKGRAPHYDAVGRARVGVARGAAALRGLHAHLHQVRGARNHDAQRARREPSRHLQQQASLFTPGAEAPSTQQPAEVSRRQRAPAHLLVEGGRTVWVGAHVQPLHRLVEADAQAPKQALPVQACMLAGACSIRGSLTPHKHWQHAISGIQNQCSCKRVGQDANLLQAPSTARRALLALRW